MEGLVITLLLLGVAAYWITPIVLLIIGLSRLKSKPENAKTLLIISAVMLVVGIGVCGAMLI